MGDSRRYALLPALQQDSTHRGHQRDIILKYGYRCRASACQFSTARDGVVVKSFALTSEPNDQFPDTLPGGFNGGVYGGSKHALEYREAAAR